MRMYVGRTVNILWVNTFRFPSSLRPRVWEIKWNRSWSCRNLGRSSSRTRVGLQRNWKVTQVLNKSADTKLDDYYSMLTSANKTTSAPCSRCVHSWLYNMTHLPSCVQQSRYIITTETSRACQCVCVCVCVCVCRCEVTSRNEPKRKVPLTRRRVSANRKSNRKPKQSEQKLISVKRVAGRSTNMDGPSLIPAELKSHSDQCM